MSTYFDSSESKFESKILKVMKTYLWGRTDSQAIFYLRIFIFILCALFWHLLFLFLPWETFFPKSSRMKPMPVEVTPLSTKDLNKIKNEWKSKPLLLDPTHQKTSKTEPKDAKFESARNTQVEKEQRARHTQILPQANKNAPATMEAPSPQNTAPTAKTRTKEISLNQLGVPLYRAPLKTPQDSISKNQQDATQRTTASGGDQSILDSTLPIGSENMLNTQESKFYNFYSRMYERIGPLWQARMHALLRTKNYPTGIYSSQVRVTLEEDGTVRNVETVRSSGISDFDELVIKAWFELAHFPNVPQAIIKNGQAETMWSFQIDLTKSMGWQMAPPERDY